MNRKKSPFTLPVLRILCIVGFLLTFSVSRKISRCTNNDSDKLIASAVQISFKAQKIEDFLYVAESPLGPMKQWPFQGERILEPNSVSTCISSRAQTVLASEIVIVVSDVLQEVGKTATGTAWCANLWQSFGSDSKLKLICVGERLTAGRLDSRGPEDAILSAGCARRTRSASSKGSKV